MTQNELKKLTKRQAKTLVARIHNPKYKVKSVVKKQQQGENTH